MATMVTTMADLDMSKDFDYARYVQNDFQEQGKTKCTAFIRMEIINWLLIILLSAEAMDRLLQCATHALPYFSASVSNLLRISS